MVLAGVIEQQAAAVPAVGRKAHQRVRRLQAVQWGGAIVQRQPGDLPVQALFGQLGAQGRGVLLMLACHDDVHGLS